MYKMSHPLTRWSILDGVVVDKVPQSVHVPVVTATHHLHLLIDCGVGKTVCTLHIQLPESGLESRQLVMGVVWQVIQVRRYDNDWRVLGTSLDREQCDHHNK